MLVTVRDGHFISATLADWGVLFVGVDLVQVFYLICFILRCPPRSPPPPPAMLENGDVFIK